MAMQIRANALRKLLIATAVVVCSVGACAAEPARIAGTYSSLTYNKQGGDLLGYEVRIIPTRHGPKAVVQIAEGGAGDIYVVDVKQSAATLSFDIPVPGGQPGRFSGEVSDDGLRGTISYPSGAKEEVFLRRTTSYWER